MFGADSKIEPSRRKLLLTAAALTPALAAVRRDNFAFGRTDENDLSTDDPALPRRARELIRIGNIGIVKEDQAAMAAFFHPQVHGPGIVSDGGDYIASRTRFAGVFARTF
jgi:hypothetical protein